MFCCSSVRSKFIGRGSVTVVTPPSRGRTYGRAMQSERGQASVEWIGLLLLISLAFAAALAFVPLMDGRPLGAAIARALVCAVKQDCHDERVVLTRAYGGR